MDCTDTLHFMEKKKTRKSKHGEAVIQNNLRKAAETFFFPNQKHKKSKNNTASFLDLSEALKTQEIMNLVISNPN